MSNSDVRIDTASTQWWVEWLEVLIRSVDQDTSDDALEFCEYAMEAWRANLSPENKPPPGSPGALIVVEAMRAVVQSMADVGFDFVHTADARDRLTREAVQESLRTALSDILDECRLWLSQGAPSADEIGRRIQAAKDHVERIQEAGQDQMDRDAADDADAAADPYGAVLGYVDPSVDAAIIFTKVSSFSEEDDEKYRLAHERLRKMIDSELLRHISDECDRFCDVLVETLRDITDGNIALSDQDAFDERRRRLRSALISFTSAIHSHKDQSIRAVRDQFGRRSAEEQKVLGLFDSLLTSSFDYRWLMKMRDALLHGDINAFKIHLSAQLDGEGEANVFMDRNYMLSFTKEARDKWLKRKELEDMTTDPSVLDMIKNVQPLISDLQDELDVVLYPHVASDAATIRELISRFDGRVGMYALQSGPGFTRRLRVPPYVFLAPRVLAFAESFEEADPPNHR